MRRSLALLAALWLAALAIPAAAGPDGFKNAGPGNFGYRVRYIGHVPLANDTAGARIVGNYFYLTTSHDLRIYDITDRKNPKLTGLVPILQEPYFSEEDPDTNGKIALVADQVVDVTDKANPRIIGTHNVDDHTISCVLDCTYAYASGGQIIDLRNPAQPVNTGRRWTTGMPATSSHDVTEIAPGLVVTSSDPVLFLDARQDPTRPTLLGQSPRRNRFAHSNLWPHQGTDRFILVGGETSGPTCSGASAQFVTLDSTGWQQGTPFQQVDEYRVQNGLPHQGNAPADLFCTHWFDTNPRYKNGGLVAIAWYEHGTRILDIKPDGQIEEAGWFLPAGGSTSAAYWATDTVIYAVDYNRGFDIIEYMGPGGAWKGTLPA